MKKIGIALLLIWFVGMMGIMVGHAFMTAGDGGEYHPAFVGASTVVYYQDEFGIWNRCVRKMSVYRKYRTRFLYFWCTELGSTPTPTFDFNGSYPYMSYTPVATAKP